MEKLKLEVQTILGIHLTNKQVAAFERYEKELLEWNSRFNLTAIRDSEGIRSKHFLDSMTCILAWGEVVPNNLIDIGTGAGFPGIPLKILVPNLQLTLVDSVGKKVEFCKFIVDALNLDKVQVIQARAEDIGQNQLYREKYDWAVARAVANLPVLAEYLLPLVKVGGGAIAQKGESGPAEAQKADQAIHLMGGRLRQLIPVSLPGVVEERYLVVMDKIAATHAQYPRRVGIPSKKPI
ncbi:MAG: 16S rRNA (guanine(527)-N(7))-methyltransferase RsmG [Anaerolineaceae bacterium]|jgi:16S rRNA (guanine527-N7)-methyltransferase